MLSQILHDSNSISFFSSLSIENVLQILDYLDIQTIENIINSFGSEKSSRNVLYTTSLAKHFFIKYLYSLDRSTFISLYDEPHFKQIENQYVQNLIMSEHQHFNSTVQTLTHIKKGLETQIRGLSQFDELWQFFLMNITDPLPPQTKLKQSSMGMYCNSAYQFYLVGKSLLKQETFYQEYIENMRENLQFLKQEQALKCKKKNSFIGKQNKQKAYFLFQRYFQLNHQNYQQLLISEQTYFATLHNICLHLIGLFDFFINVTIRYLDGFCDIFHQFVEFNTRYSYFRSAIIEIENQLGFLFQLYTEQYLQLFGESQLMSNSGSNFNLSNVLLTKWRFLTQSRLKKYDQVYSFLLVHINFVSLKSQLSNEGKLFSQSCYLSLINQLQMEKQNIFLHFDQVFCCPILQLLLDEQISHQLIKQYQEYLIDVSISSETVHWCGHSQQCLDFIYHEHEKNTIKTLLQYLQKLQPLCCAIDKNNFLFQQIVMIIFYELDKEYIKPVTLKKLVKIANEKWKKKILPKSQKFICTQIELQTDCEDCQDFIAISFGQRDRKIQFYNGQNGIQKGLYQTNKQSESQQYFEIGLKQSAQTNCSTGKINIAVEGLQNQNFLRKTSSYEYKIQ